MQDGQGSPTPRELRRARQLETRRREILGAAETLFDAHGYDGTSIEKIAADSGHSVGTLYNIFPSKEAVYAAVLDSHARSLAERLASCLGSDDSGIDKLLEMTATAIQDMRGFPGHARLAIGSLTSPHAAGPASRDRKGTTGAMLEAYAAAIWQGQDDGTIRTGDPRGLARHVGGLIQAHVHVDPEIAGGPGGIPIEDFLEIVGAALRAPAPA